MKRKPGEIFTAGKHKVVWNKNDRIVVVVDKKIVYTRNQKETLDGAEK
ncbi:MAG: hypothetical protein KGI50_05210 [Patescibacteria group bacterium]|nr:hypothetical protein [Patescibacteria group bacterium]MDE2438718.1 hypothetical protein [Patescibacteria group bacterium]